MSKIKRALIIPDCHHPFAGDEYQLMIEISQQMVIDEIVLLGDYLDFFDVSSHEKDIEIQEKLFDEIHVGNEKLQELRDLHPKARIVFCEGNHEFRLKRFLKSNAPQLFGMFDLKSLLHLEEKHIELVDYGPNQKHHVLGSGLIARHKPIGGGVHCAHSTVVKACSSVIFGHTHRIQKSNVVDLAFGQVYEGISCGWLGNKDHQAMQYVENHHQWQSGFAIVDVVENDFDFHVQLVHIKNGRALVDGSLWWL